MSENLVDIRNLNVRFSGARTIHAINDLTLTLKQGETLALLGESGSGKSVTLKTLLRLLPPKRTQIEGEIEVNGVDVLTLSGKALQSYRGEEVSMVFQEPGLALDPVYTVGAQIAEAVMRHKGVRREEAMSTALDMLRRVRIPSPERRLRNYPHELSGGMLQRVMIALALACRPRLLLADEPTTALDATVQIQILLLLRDLQREFGMGVIFVTHDIGVAVEVSERIAVMYAGQIVEEGTTREIIKDPRHPYTRGLLAANLHDAARGSRLNAIPGAPPALDTRPDACSFAPRCPLAELACRAALPPVHIPNDRRRVACIHANAPMVVEYAMLIDKDPYHCFMPYEPVPVAAAPNGPLAGLTLAVKDIYDVAGYRTGSGCPTRLAASPVATVTAPAVQRLLDAGARFVGKTHTDELAWSMYGMNAHFGTPVNPAAPDRIPGGSSSGSAVAVAGGLADIAIGSDTGGSVRAPASFCGTWGLRPTHGRVSLDRVQPLAPSYDTCGVFARDGDTLLRTAQVLLEADTAPLPAAPQMLRPGDMLAQLPPEALAIWDAVFGDIDACDVAVYPDGVEAAYTAFLTSMGGDAKSAIVPWIRASGMPLVRGIDQRAAAAEALSDEQIAQAETARLGFVAHMEGLLGQGGVLLAPIVPGAPFRLDAPTEVFDAYRHDAMRLLCVAGLAKLPQVAFPAGTVDGAPYGLSLIGPRGSDLSLISLAITLGLGTPE